MRYGVPTLTLSSGARKPEAEPWFAVVAGAASAVDCDAFDVRGADAFVPESCEPLALVEPCEVAWAFAPRTSFMPGRISDGSEPTTSRLSW